jgi:hypothetical protein
LRVFGAAGSAGSVKPVSVTSAASAVSTTAGTPAFFLEFFGLDITAFLRGDFGSIAMSKYLHFKI